MTPFDPKYTLERVPYMFQDFHLVVKDKRRHVGQVLVVHYTDHIWLAHTSSFNDFFYPLVLEYLVNLYPNMSIKA